MSKLWQDQLAHLHACARKHDRRRAPSLNKAEEFIREALQAATDKAVKATYGRVVALDGIERHRVAMEACTKKFGTPHFKKWPLEYVEAINSQAPPAYYSCASPGLKFLRLSK